MRSGSIVTPTRRSSLRTPDSQVSTSRRGSVVGTNAWLTFVAIPADHLRVNAHSYAVARSRRSCRSLGLSSSAHRSLGPGGTCPSPARARENLRYFRRDHRTRASQVRADRGGIVAIAGHDSARPGDVALGGGRTQAWVHGGYARRRGILVEQAVTAPAQTPVFGWGHPDLGCSGSRGCQASRLPLRRSHAGARSKNGPCP